MFLKYICAASIAVASFLMQNTVFAAGDSVFSGTKVHTINIRFPQPNYWDSLLFLYNQGDEQYIAATVIANGVTYTDVGVRLKGNSSFTHPNNKKGIRLAFDEFVGSQRWDGMKSVHLNNVWNDPSFIREKLHLDYCNQNGIPSPRGNFARVLINDTLFALYSLVEHVDKTFLTARFGDDEGDQFKAVDAVGTIGDIFSDFKWLGSRDSTLYFDHYDLKSDEELYPWWKLISLIDTLNHSSNIPTSLPNKLNMYGFYRAMAMDIIFGNLDSYLYTGRNFYVYFTPPSYKMDWIVWDASLSLGALPGGPSDIEDLSVTFIESDTSRPLFGKILNIPSLRTQYLYELCNLLSAGFSTSALYPKIDSIVTLIRPYVYEDPRKMFTNQQFETNVISDITVQGRRIPGVKSYISLRKNSIQSQLNNYGIDCSQGVISNITPLEFELNQNYPNPFNPSTQIQYSILKSGKVNITVFDNLGKEVAKLVNGNFQSPGDYTIEWNGKDFNGADVSSGIYYYRLTFGNESNVVTKKMILVR